MNLRMNWLYRLLLLLIILINLLLFWHIKPLWLPLITLGIKILIPFVAACFISYLLYPIIEWLHSKGVSRGWAVALIYFVFFGASAILIYLGFPKLTEQMQELAENAPAVADKYKQGLNWLDAKTRSWPLEFRDKMDQIIDFAEAKAEGLLDRVIRYGSRTFDYVLLIALIPFVAFYIMKDYHRFKRQAAKIFPSRYKKKGVAFLQDLDVSLGGYIRGQLLICLIIGVMSIIAFWVIRLKYPLVLGTVIAVTNVIPYFGPIIGAIPAIIVAASTSVQKVILVIVIMLLLQFIEGNIISPFIVGKSLHMHPLFIIFALLIGEEVFGIIGMIISVPLLAILKVILQHANIHFRKTIEED